MNDMAFDQRLQEADGLTRAGDHAAAEALLLSLARERPDAPAVLRRLGLAKARRFDYPGARADLEAACSLAPDDAATAMALARLYERMALPRLADAAARQALAALPGHAPALALLARTAPTGADETALLPAIDTALADPTLAAADRIALNGAAARILHLAGDADAAFDRYKAANDARGQKDDAAARERLAGRIMAAFQDLDWPRHRPEARIILISGLPFSGQAFFSEVLASAPDVALVEDSAILTETAVGLRTYAGTDTSFPECIGRLSKDGWEAASAGFLARLFEASGPARAYVLAPPTGFLQAGLAAALVPGAAIVDLRRPALPATWAAYMKGPMGGADYSAGFESLGRLYRIYERATAFWAGALPDPMTVVDAEAMARDPAAAAARVLAEVGLDLHEDCLARIEATPEAARFGDDIGVDGWRAYAKRLAPLRQQLWPLA